MSRRFTDPEFEEICVNFWHYAKAHRYGGPRLPPGFAKVLNEGSATHEVDYPLNKYFPALALVIESFDPVEQIAFYAVYISAGYRNGRKIPIKVLASEVGINRANFYKKADSVAQRAWKQAKNLTMLHSKLYKTDPKLYKAEDSIVD